jgi:hypothetical protein
MNKSGLETVQSMRFVWDPRKFICELDVTNIDMSRVRATSIERAEIHPIVFIVFVIRV